MTKAARVMQCRCILSADSDLFVCLCRPLMLQVLKGLRKRLDQMQQEVALLEALLVRAEAPEQPGASSRSVGSRPR